LGILFYADYAACHACVLRPMVVIYTFHDKGMSSGKYVPFPIAIQHGVNKFL